MIYMRSFLFTVLVVTSAALGGCAGEDGGGEQEPWADENGAVGEPSGSLSGAMGGAAFNAVVDRANFQENQSSFSIGGQDTVNFPDAFLSIGLTIDRDIIGVGQFDCSVLGEAGISARIPVAAAVGGGVTTTYVQSSADYPCTITINQFGNVGEPITGSFSGTLIESGSQGLQVSGSINAIRGSVVLNQ